MALAIVLQLCQKVIVRQCLPAVWVLAVIDASIGAYLPTIVVKLQWDLSNMDTLVVVHLGGGGGGAFFFG